MDLKNVVIRVCFLIEGDRRVNLSDVMWVCVKESLSKDPFNSKELGAFELLVEGIKRKNTLIDSRMRRLLNYTYKDTQTAKKIAKKYFDLNDLKEWCDLHYARYESSFDSWSAERKMADEYFETVIQK